VRSSNARLHAFATIHGLLTLRTENARVIYLFTSRKILKWSSCLYLAQVLGQLYELTLLHSAVLLIHLSRMSPSSLSSLSDELSLVSTHNFILSANVDVRWGPSPSPILCVINDYAELEWSRKGQGTCEQGTFNLGPCWVRLMATKSPSWNLKPLVFPCYKFVYSHAGFLLYSRSLGLAVRHACLGKTQPIPFPLSDIWRIFKPWTYSQKKFERRHVTASMYNCV